ncbi:MAG: dTDP-4-dehydrorhamnose reductase [Chlorobi bacterium]|nr:dTDP-4-dehydrorhamnose reductase [Chlorobiota bacterium]
MKKILVTGSKGQLGSEIRDLSPGYPGFQFEFIDIDELDLTDAAAVQDFFTEKHFEFCINCSAYTAVDKAEEEEEMAMAVNFTAVKNLAHILAGKKTFLIHISTDYVFDGKNHKPYTETDTTSPQSVYGLSKLKGEEAVLKSTADAIIIRTSWLYSGYGNNFVKTILRLAKERDTINVVADQVGTPTYAGDLAKAILEIIASEKLKPGKQIYHYSNEGVTSWFDFARAIVDEYGLNCKILPIETKDFPTKATRPFYSILNKRKIKQDFQMEIPYWRDSLKVVLKRLNV